MQNDDARFDVPGGVCLYAPFGTVEPLTAFAPNLPPQSAEVARLPVLTAAFDATKFSFGQQAPMIVAWGLYRHPMATMFSFRLQVGADMMCWLVNPNDAATWTMLDAWHEAGLMALVPRFADGTALLMTRPFELVSPAHELRPSNFDSEECRQSTLKYVCAAGVTLLSGQLAEEMPSDIATVSRLRNVQACSVATTSTGRVPVHHTIAHHARCQLVALPWERSHHAVESQANAAA